MFLFLTSKPPNYVENPYRNKALVAQFLAISGKLNHAKKLSQKLTISLRVIFIIQKESAQRQGDNQNGTRHQDAVSFSDYHLFMGFGAWFYGTDLGMDFFIPARNQNIKKTRFKPERVIERRS
jgi:hypothetical protein